jgi:hypothetical protein
MAEQRGWAELPDELMHTVLERLEWAPHVSAAVRATTSQWRRAHDAGLKTLTLRATTDEAAGALCARMTSLTQLRIRSSSSLTNEGLRMIAESGTGARRLTHLSLVRCRKVTTKGLKAICGITSLTHLSLVYCPQITAEGLREVARLQSLIHLHLPCSAVTDGGLREIAACRSLIHLNLSYCAVTDEGLQALSSLPALTRLDLRGCFNVQQAQVAAAHRLEIKFWD